MVNLPLNVFQSVDVKHPNVVVLAVAQVSAFDTEVRPLPRRLLNDEPLTMRFVVEAVRNDE